MITRDFHERRFARMLRDLGVDPGALIVEGEGFALIDGNTGRALSVPLGNQTLAEGLLSAIKLAAATGAREAGQ